MRAALGLLALAVTVAQRNKPQGVQLSSSPYDILGVHRRATVQEIRNAYRAKARETHPDKARPGREAAEEVAEEHAVRVVREDLELQ